ncbi:MAG: methylated-DNA--[protein]-cysteine S-methyltransferase [Fusobacterium sp.]|uniref:methylated-DNA--[protein]-cysteine S-methyltransferase n=1 Tax=Fusobacterium sp. TaxID=68766 RepID=UPI0026DD9901|nr:methylated-DNA--[protein]-cysteine S-methyltransferase [Fusobacterium sp.]MDO4690027.1 methylated-DNA--[protein]-cysteine S-methyltransferase [Fusobacterium sp.]
MKGVSFLENNYLGLIAIIEERDGISAIEFLKNQKDRIELLRNMKESVLTKDCKKQLEEYFSGKRRKFNIKLDTMGTDFQKSAWEAMQKIPYGKTISYSEEAKMIGNEKAVRAIGLANGKNRIPIIIPCHRVIGKNGKLVGYTGGLHIKEYLLNLEKTYSM